MKKIYLDYNIIVRLTNKNEPELDELISLVKSSAHIVVYSPAHIEEIAVSTMRNDYPIEKTNEKLEFLSSLTKNIELLPFLRPDVRIIEELGIYLCEENPADCYKRVTDEYKGNDLAESNEKAFLVKALEENQYNNNPNEMNNIAPEKVLLDQIYDLKIKESFFMHLLGRRTKKQIYSLMNEGFAKIQTDFQALETLLSVIFNKLEVIRYYPEKEMLFRSRLHDVSHAIYASYCDYFVTEDLKLSKKTKAAYSYANIKTNVIDLKKLKEITF